jgi:Rhs element Vgr protein
MSNTTSIPNPSRHDVVTFDILSDGSVIDTAYEVMSISIVKEVNRIPTAKIVIRDGDAAQRTFHVSEQDDFVPGKKITIKIGLDRQNKTLFKGIVVRHSIKIRETGQADLFIECKDESVKMTIGRHSRYFEEKKDSEIMEEIIGRYSLSNDVEATSLKHREMVQHHCTDWDFILSRAEVNGRLIMVDDGKIEIKKPDTRAGATLNLAYGSSLLEFEAEMDARTQWQSVEAKSWDYAAQQLFESNADSAPVSEPGNLPGSAVAEAINLDRYELRHGGHAIEEEIKSWADAVMLKSRLAKICGRAKFTGFPDLKPGQTVTLQGLGARFNGKAFVSGVRHDMGAGSWDTQIQFGVQPNWFAASQNDIMDVPAAGLLPGINGLQAGKVVQLQNDPEGGDRILVKLPIIDPNAQGLWARVASLDAGADRGAFFRPEIDDEVIVGFINDDPRDAVVLGMLHSSANPAPITAQDVNHEKGFTTRSKMHIHFHDQTKTITIDTPAGNSIKLDEAGMSITIQDQNGNKINLSPSGIDIESPKNVNIKAGINLSLSAGATLSIGGAQISASAQGPVSLSGATAKLAGSGITEISGGLVKIN